VEIFQALLISHTTKNGELVNLSSHFVPDPDKAADAGTPNRAAHLKKPPVPASRAVALAARNLEETLDDASVSAAEPQAEGAALHQHFKAPPLNGTADAKLVWLPMSQKSLRLCWEIVLTSRARGEMYRV